MNKNPEKGYRKKLQGVATTPLGWRRVENLAHRLAISLGWTKGGGTDKRYISSSACLAQAFHLSQYHN